MRVLLATDPLAFHARNGIHCMPWSLHCARRSGTATEPVELAFAFKCMQLELLLGVDDVHDGVDQRKVRECLREVTEVAASGRVELLSVQSEWTRMRKQLLAESAGACQLPDLRQRRHQPERADCKRALAAGEAI